MKIDVNYTFKEGFLPTPRSRKLRFRDKAGIVSVEVKEVTTNEAPIAMIADNLEYRWLNDLFWVKVAWSDKHCGKNGLLPVDELKWYINGIYDYWNYSVEEIEQSYIQNAQRYLIIDGEVYQTSGEPRYVLMTFGLGHNHGGTSLMIDNWYNPNISKNRYFNALEKEKAVEEALKVANSRGDTKSIDRIGKSWHIEVIIPESVKCNPQKEHGEGCEFINQLNEITDNSSDIIEAGLKVMAFGIK